MAKLSGITATEMTWQEGSAPTTPASTKWKVYFKTDGIYIMDDAGTETGPLGGSSSAGHIFKRTVLNGNGNKTTTSATFTAIDSTNLAYLTLTLSVNDVVRCTLMGQHRHSSTNATGYDFQVDQPTSADTSIGTGADYGCAELGGTTNRSLLNVVGYFTATEAGVHGFRPSWRTDGGTATLCNGASSNDDTLIQFMVENLGAVTA